MRRCSISDRRRVSGTDESEVRGVHATKEACQHLIYMIKLFKELNWLSMVKDVEINDSQPKLETCEDDSACISWSENETVYCLLIFVLINLIIIIIIIINIIMI